jgi:AhpD family alkylhydroperoxidase
MESCFNFFTAAPHAYEAVRGLEEYLHDCDLEESLMHLVKLRASQINGCAYCLDMHWKGLRSIGEGEQRLGSLDAWRE